MSAEKHAGEQSAGIRAPCREQRQQNDERAVMVVHLENAQQAEQQVRHEQRAEKAPRHLRHLHAVVEFQLDGERADEHDENKTLHHVGQVERQHGKMTDRETERHEHREQQLEPVVHELRRAEHLTGRDDAQRRDDRLQNDGRKYIQREQHKNKAKHAE